MLTQARLKEVLRYDPDTGVFTWRVTLNARGVSGSTAGTARSDGYRKIQINYIRYYEHRLAWFYTYGVWPASEVDHADGDPRNNSIANLRLADRRLNSANARLRADNKSGYKGVRWDPRRRNWYSVLSFQGKQIRTGTFSTAEEAHAAYVTVAREYFGRYARAS